MSNGIDPLFRVEVLDQTAYPNRLMYLKLHQCYCENFVAYEPINLSETRCGEIVIDRLLAGNKGHFGILESPKITFNVGWFPHSVMQQLRTHRVGVSFGVQSGRYSGKRILDVANGIRNVKEVFYFRPLGKYTDRQGHKYEYTHEEREKDMNYCIAASAIYAEKIEKGFSEEHARSFVPFDIRQHFVLDCNVRSYLHLADLRAKKNAQLECQQFIQLTWEHFTKWVPNIAEWYEKNRMGKALLAP